MPRHLSRRVVEFVHDPLHLLVSDGGAITALREVVPNEAVGVFVEAALLGGIRMSEGEVSPQGLSNAFVRGESLAVVRSEGVNPPSQRLQQVENGSFGALGCLGGHLDDQSQARLARGFCQ